MTGSRSSLTVVAVGLAATLAAVVHPAAAQPSTTPPNVGEPLTLNPGQRIENIVASPWEVRDTAPGLLAWTELSFDWNFLEEPNVQYMRVGAHALADLTASASANVVGRLFKVFCVPRTGQTECDDEPDPDAPEVVATITFRYGIFGTVEALGPLSKATLHVTGSVVDHATGEFVNFQELANQTASNGSVKTIASFPVPVPGINNQTINSIVTFTSPLTRGKKYRFMLSAGVTAKGGYRPLFSPPGPFGAHSNFSVFGVASNPLKQGHIQLSELTIDVANLGGTDLEARVAQLESIVAELHQQVNALTGQTQALATDVEADALELVPQLSAIRAELPPGPPGPEGPQGPIGQTGPTGEGLVPGSLLFLAPGATPPPGYTFVGTFDMFPAGGSRGRPTTVAFDVYRRH